MPSRTSQFVLQDFCTLQQSKVTDVEIEYLDDTLVKGTTVVRLYNPTGKLDRQRHIAVSLVLRVRSAEREAIERNFHRLTSTFVPLLQSQRVDSIAGQDDLSSLAAWLVARLRNRGMGAARLERLELMDDAGPSYSISPSAAAHTHPDADGDFVSLLQSCELVGHFTSAERYNTRSDREVIRQIIAHAGGDPVPLACFLCPPYVGQVDPAGSVRYVGVHDSFDDEPASYNFDYHYRLYIECLSGVARLAESRGIAINPMIVFSDWALIGIDDIRATLGSDEAIVGRMARFRDGMARYAGARTPAVSVISFQEIGVADYFPLGLPTSGTARESWLRDFAGSSDATGATALDELLAYAKQSGRLRELLDWRAFTTIPGSPHRSTVIDCLKVYHNICRLRFAALPDGEQKRLGDIASDQASGLRYEAYLDAVLRLVQYQLYSRLFVERFGNAICCYQDPGFTACGNLFRRPMFPILFLDPKLVLSMS